jgi:hypothetical protein
MTKKSEGVSYDDDECGQIELLPMSNWQHCEGEIKIIAEFSKAHDTGVGWTDVYCRKPIPQSVNSLRLKAQELRNCISQFLPPLSPVRLWWGEELKVCQHTLANGTDQACVLFLGVGADEVVTDIWLRLDIATADHIVAISSAFAAIAEKWDLLLVDWGWCWLLRIDDTSGMKDYLEKRKQVFGKNN